MPYNFNMKLQANKYWTVEIDTAAKYGCFEHNENGTGGGLWFQTSDISIPGITNKLELIDYDGIAVLPKSIVNVLRLAGFVLDETFD